MMEAHDDTLLCLEGWGKLGRTLLRRIEKSLMSQIFRFFSTLQFWINLGYFFIYDPQCVSNDTFELPKKFLLRYISFALWGTLWIKFSSHLINCKLPNLASTYQLQTINYVALMHIFSHPHSAAETPALEYRASTNSTSRLLLSLQAVPSLWNLIPKFERERWISQLADAPQN